MISIIAVLSGILMPALGKARQQGRAISCRHRIRQQLVALHTHAQANDGKLPRPQTQGLWIWALDPDFTDSLEHIGIKRDFFYCPSNITMEKHQDIYWGVAASHRHVGYTYLIDWPQAGRPEINGPGEKRWLHTVQDRNASRAELVVDSVQCDSQASPKSRYPQGQFGGIAADHMWSEYQILSYSNHLETDARPLGANVGFLDGHVDWRKFTDMHSRYQSGAYQAWW